jgi:hypothetical protein
MMAKKYNSKLIDVVASCRTVGNNHGRSTDLNYLFRISKSWKNDKFPVQIVHNQYSCEKI